MVLKNYVVVPVDVERVSHREIPPVVMVNFRRVVDGELLQIEHRHVPLDIVLHESPVVPHTQTDLPWDEIQNRLDELFVHFLESAGETWPLNTWFDLVRLLDSRITTYHVVASSETIAQLNATGGTEEGMNGSGFTLYHHWFEIVEQPHLGDATCYVIPPEYYVTYLYQDTRETSYRVSVCSFLDLSEQVFQPIQLQSQSVVDLLIAGHAHAYVEPTRRRIAQTALVPQSKGALSPRPEQLPVQQFSNCPACGGTIQNLNERDAFCLDCDWDNLKPIS